MRLPDVRRTLRGLSRTGRSGVRAQRLDGLARALRRAQPARNDIPLIVVVVIAAAFYEWTAQSSLTPGQPVHHSYYYLLADSFLHLQTHLRVDVPAGLKALANPYDPATNASFGFHDVSFYKGQLYLSWLPTPSAVLYLPLRLLGIEMTDPTALFIFSTLALTFAILLMRRVVRRLLPTARNWTLVAGAIALAFGTAVPWLLRRPEIYEVAIACGACFMMAALYLLARGMLDERAPRRGTLAAASLCMGLAFGSRPTLLLGGGVCAAVAVAVWRRPDLSAALRRRTAVALLAPLLCCIVLIGVYNVDRFGSPTQFGVGYVLAGIDQSRLPTFQLGYVPPGVYYFAFAPPRLTLTFPHVFLPPPPGYPGTLPSGYVGTGSASPEPTGGLVPMAPIVLFAAAAMLLRRRRETLPRELPAIIGGLVLLGVGIIFGLAFALYATTERYEVDFDLLLIVAGVLGWIGLISAVRRPRRRRVVTVAGALAIAWTTFTGMAVSITGYYNLLFVLHPSTFYALEDLTSPLATLPTMLIGRPVITRIESPAPVIYPPVNYGTFGEGGVSTYLGEGTVTLTVLAPGSQDLDIRADTGPGFQPTRGPLAVEIRSPGVAPITQTCPTGTCHLHIHVHWGLNRIKLDTPGGPTGGLAIGLGDIVLAKRDPPRHR